MEKFANVIDRVEGLIYAIVGGMLAIAALVILGDAAVAFVADLGKGDVGLAVVRLLEHLLLALMAAELIYTVSVSVRTHRLSAEPFLVVGLVAAVRRILTLSVEAAHLLEGNDLERFRMALYEIGLLTGTVLVLVLSIYFLRKGRLPEESEVESRPA